MGEQDGTIFDELRTVSENNPGDIPPAEETPPENEDGTGDPADHPTEPGESADGNEQEPGEDTPDQDKEDKEDVPTVIIEDSGAEEWRENVTEQLTELMKPEDTTDVTERLDALIRLLTPEEETGEPEPYAAVFSFEGYTEWDYPITMQFMVYPYGMGNWLENTQTFPDAESFMTRYEEIIGLCGEGGTLKDFYVQYIWDGNEELLYDYDAQTPEPEPDPGDEEEKETVELLLSHLERINAILPDMIQADAEYYQMVKDYQTDMLEMQAASTATDIFILVGVFAIFAALVWAQFFRRFK